MKNAVKEIENDRIASIVNKIMIAALAENKFQISSKHIDEKNDFKTTNTENTFSSFTSAELNYFRFDLNELYSNNVYQVKKNIVYKKVHIFCRRVKNFKLQYKIKKIRFFFNKSFQKAVI